MKRHHKHHSIGRSGTGTILPNIGSLTKHHEFEFESRKSYMTIVNKEIKEDIAYEEKDIGYIGQEQKRLKGILTKMNKDTTRVLLGLHPRQKKTLRRTATSVLSVKEKQSENNQQILEGYKQEIERLEQKHQKLINGSQYNFEEQIQTLKEQIETTREVIHELKLANGKRGKDIVFEDSSTYENQLKGLQVEKYVLEHKHEKLLYNSRRVREQMEEIQKNTNQTKQKYLEAQEFIKKKQLKEKNIKNMKENKEKYQQKKSQLQAAQKKKEFHQTNSQFRYLKQLQDVDSVTKSIILIDNKIEKINVSNQAAKTVIQKLQEQWIKLKNQKKQKQQHLNEFLSKTKQSHLAKFNEQKQTSFLKDDISEIQIKNESKEANNSYFLINQEINEEKKIKLDENEEKQSEIKELKDEEKDDQAEKKINQEIKQNNSCEKNQEPQV